MVCSEETMGVKTPRKSQSSIMNTVVVPAYKENLNIRPLTERLFKALDEHGMKKYFEHVDIAGRDFSEGGRDGV